MRILVSVVVVLVACGDDGSATGDGGAGGVDAGSRADGGDRVDTGMPSGDAGSGVDGGAIPDTDGGLPAPSTGCGRAPAADGARTVDVPAQGARTYLVELPGGYDSDTPWPLVFGFHGATTSGMLFASRFYGNLASAMGDEAILVYPDAQGEPTAWDDAVDIPFFDALLAQVESDYCVDEDRVFATGHSSGGFFSNSLGCQRGDVLRAIAPVSGGGPFGRPTCRGEVAVFLAHGTADPTVPFATGQASRDYWATRNGCDTGSTTGAPPSPCVAYACTGQPEWWCEHGGEHEWPAFAPAAIWAFFSGL